MRLHRRRHRLEGTADRLQPQRPAVTVWLPLNGREGTCRFEGLAGVRIYDPKLFDPHDPERMPPDGL
jgi:hypothetical protein